MRSGYKNQEKTVVLQRARLSRNENYNSKGLRKSRNLKKKLDIPQRSTYISSSESKDSKHYYTSKAFSFSIL